MSSHTKTTFELDSQQLHNMAMDEELLGLRLPSGKPCIVQALADDHIMFLAPIPGNIGKTIDVWELFSNASGLRINMHKSVLISCTEQAVLGLGWSRRIVHRVMIWSPWISNWGGCFSCKTY